MRVLRITIKSLVVLLSLSIASCASCSLAGIGIPGVRLAGRRITVLAYNAENLFDDVSNGTEYREYDPATGEWSSELFHIKMQHLAEVLRAEKLMLLTNTSLVVFCGNLRA